jgi:hypothetical protein
VKTFFLAFLLFVLVRGMADTERFDLSLPFWAIVMISLLIERSRSMNDNAIPVVFTRRFDDIYVDGLPHTGKT